MVTKVLKLRSEMLSKSGVSEEKLLGAGIVIPGPFGQTGVSGLGSDLAGWQDIDAQYLFADALKLPVELSNDANAAAMSERIANGLHNFAYLYFGAGLGLGLVNHGQLVSGAFGNAGEIGHVPVLTEKGPIPLERQLSRVSVQEFMGSEVALDIAAIEQLFEERNPRFMTWLDAGTSALTQAISLIENLFDPQTIILGGAMPKVVLDHLASQYTPSRIVRLEPR